MWEASWGREKYEVKRLVENCVSSRGGSQGQNKTDIIAHKRAQDVFLKEKDNACPVLLLDDIFDKLDAERVEEIVRLVSGDHFGQIFITDTNRKYLDAILEHINHDYALFRVEQGEVQTLYRKTE